MKLQNIKVGDLIEVKADIAVRRLFSDDLVVPSGTICKVVNKEHADYTSKLSVFIESEGIKTWCNHKDLRKHLPKLKQLDQSVFDGLDEKWQFAAVDEDGRAHRCTHGAEVKLERGEFYCGRLDFEYELIGAGYDATDWKDSLIERDKVELTGKALVKAILNSGKDKVLVRVSNFKSADFNDRHISFARKDGFSVVTNNSDTWECMDAISDQGEILTAKDVGL